MSFENERNLELEKYLRKLKDIHSRLNSISHRKNEAEILKIAIERFDAELYSLWWCPWCLRKLDDEEVTYEETHDERIGGCGREVK